MNEMIIVKKGAEGIYEEKKSKFIAMVYSVSREEEVSEIIDATRKKYWDARHNCYAFVIGDNNEVTRCSDDGEPSGTAGKPILEVLTKAGIHNCLVIVTRYFGGTLLGTGGLVRAYTKATSDAITNSTLARMIPGVRYLVETDYNGVGKIQYSVANLEAEIINSEYTDKVLLTIDIKKSREEGFVKKITEITNGKAIIEKDCDLPIEEIISA